MATSSYLRSSPLAQASQYRDPSSSAAPSRALWKEMANQQLTDQDILGMFGQGYVQEDAGKRYYTGRVDPSEFQYGVHGYQTEDLGQGKFSIKGPEGQVLGTGYRSPKQALQEIVTKNLFSGITSEKAPTLEGYPTWAKQPTEIYSHPLLSSTDEFGSPRTFNSRGEIERELMKKYSRMNQDLFGQNRSDLEYYNALGAALKGKGLGDLGQSSILPGSLAHISERGFAGPEGTSRIKGEQALYGSDPLIRKKLAEQSQFLKPDDSGYGLLGYRIDMSPASGGAGNRGGLAQVKSDLSGKTQSMATLYRQFRNPEEWKKLGSGLPSGDFLVKAENASKIPGWDDKYNYEYHKAKDGLFGKAFDFLDPILDKLDPLHNFGQDLAVKITGSDSQKEAFNKVAPIVASFFGPWGQMLNAFNSASTGNMSGALMSGIGAGMGFSGYNPSTGISGGIQGATGWSPAVSNAAASGLVSGTMGGLGSLASGGNFGRGFASGALGGAAGNYTGNLIRGATSGLSSGLSRGLTAAGSSLAGGLASSLAAGHKISPQALALSTALAGAKGYTR